MLRGQKSSPRSYIESLFGNVRSSFQIQEFLSQNKDGCFCCLLLALSDFAKGLGDPILLMYRMILLNSLPAPFLSRSSRLRIPVLPVEEMPSCRKDLRLQPAPSSQPSASLFEWVDPVSLSLLPFASEPSPFPSPVLDNLHGRKRTVPGCWHIQSSRD